MPVVSNKAELVALLADPNFVALLAANCSADLETIGAVSANPDDRHNQYTEKSWDDDAAEDGVYLFDTPQKSIGAGPGYGTHLSVIKLYGDKAYPFRVIASEYAPWGNGEEPDDQIGDFRTLGSAVVMAFHVHERGDLQLDVPVENENATAPEHALLSESFSRWEPPAPKPREFDDAAIDRILEIARSHGFNPPAHAQGYATDLINARLLNGEGVLIGVVNQDLFEKRELCVGVLGHVLMDADGVERVYHAGGVTTKQAFEESAAIDWNSFEMISDLGKVGVVGGSFDAAKMISFRDAEEDVDYQQEAEFDYHQLHERALTTAIEQFLQEHKLAKERAVTGQDPLSP
jgi:hypothetical protein